MRKNLSFFFALALAVGTIGGLVHAQRSGRPAADWIVRLERPERVAGLNIDFIVSKLGLKPGQTVADLGAGPGVFSMPFARAVAPGGKVYAVEIDQAFLDHIAMRTTEQKVENVKPVLGKFTDPALPARDVDLAFFHDVLHHIEDRAGYIKSLGPYVKPGGRIAVIELSATTGSHKDEPDLVVTKEQTRDWMAAVGFAPVEEIEGLTEGKWFVVYGRK